ncbi:MAG TPA: FAD-dependent oxidoreductase [Thermoleophilaceae bacterium]|nr:FAD-dependent oxidoreductase [Thermoleophilaceae bacterium]
MATRVLVAGGGIAAVELVVALRKLAGERVEIEVLAPNDELVYRPLLVAEPFGAGAVHRFPLDEILADQQASRRATALAEVHDHAAVIADGQVLPYDALAIATGALSAGSFPGALDFGEPADVARFKELLARLESGEFRRLAFALPHDLPTWPLPLYELALMTAARVPKAEIVLVTPETAPLAMFGRAGSDAVAELLGRAGIELRIESGPDAFESGKLTLVSGESLAVDAVVAVPRLRVPPLPGVPQGEHGFIATDELSRVEGLDDVYAAGDVTAFPVKQGGVAVRQAQAAATCIAAHAGAPVRPEPFEPVLRDVMLTGAAPSYLESAAGESLSAESPLWWPPTKIADSYLVPYLLARFQLAVAPAGEGLVDLVSTGAVTGQPVPARPTRPIA